MLLPRVADPDGAASMAADHYSDENHHEMPTRRAHHEDDVRHKQPERAAGPAHEERGAQAAPPKAQG